MESRIYQAGKREMKPTDDPTFIHQWDQSSAHGNAILDALIATYRSVKTQYSEPEAILAMAEELDVKAHNTMALAQYLALAVARIGNALDTAENNAPKTE